MRGPKLIALALVALAVGAFILFFERHQPTTDERLERADRVFPELDVDDVTTVELVTSHGPVHLVRNADTDEWRLEVPIAFAADSVSVRSLLESLAALKVERTLPLGEVSLADYGLEVPLLSAVLVDSKGRRFELSIGDETPLGSRRAVRRGDEQSLVMTTDSFVAKLDQELDGWRSRKVVDVAEHQLASIEVETADDRIRAVQLKGRWQLLEPLADLADEKQIRALVSDLDTLRVREFLPSDSDPAAFGLDRPEYRLLLVRSDGDDPVTLELAAPAADETTGTVVCRRDNKDLFTVPDSIRTRLAKAPVLWRSAEVWPFETWDVTKIKLTGGTEEVVLDQDDGVWRFADDGGDADEVEVRRRLNALSELKVEDFDLLLPPTEALGSVTLEFEDDDVDPVTITFYAPLETGGHAGVTVSARDTVMGTDEATVETIIGDLGAFRPKVESPPSDE
jgi:hypothetical protein